MDKEEMGDAYEKVKEIMQKSEEGATSGYQIVFLPFRFSCQEISMQGAQDVPISRTPSGKIIHMWSQTFNWECPRNFPYHSLIQKILKLYTTRRKAGGDRNHSVMVNFMCQLTGLWDTQTTNKLLIMSAKFIGI